ncbi:hypothetical protein [Legionella fallonii]|nr:hypothetical protein [Legionella fallonii]
MSYETYMQVHDIAVAHRRPPITMKGISRQIVPYVFDRFVENQGP